MKIPAYSELKQRTDSALAVAREPKKVILAYAGIISLLGLLVTGLSAMLEHKLSGTGGLAHMGSRSILTTIQTLLPIAQSILLMGLEVGYISAAMRLARKQYADHTDLRTGFRLFAPYIRLTLLQTLILTGIMMVAYYVAAQLFLFSPFAQPLLDVITPILESEATENIQLPDGFILLILPYIVITLVLFALAAIPISYRYRMAIYHLVDHPRDGARIALRSSWQMMRGNLLALFKVDLHFWLYYLLSLLATAICYGDTLLAFAGISLPMSDTVAFFLFYILYLVIQFFLFYRFRNQLEMTYVTAYDAICPQRDDGSVVLGNIFDMG